MSPLHSLTAEAKNICILNKKKGSSEPTDYVHDIKWAIVYAAGCGGKSESAKLMYFMLLDGIQICIGSILME